MFGRPRPRKETQPNPEPTVQQQIKDAVAQLELKQIIGVFSEVFGEECLLDKTALDTANLGLETPSEPRMLGFVQTFVRRVRDRDGFNYYSIVNNDVSAVVLSSPENLIALIKKIVLYSDVLQPLKHFPSDMDANDSPASFIKIITSDLETNRELDVKTFNNLIDIFPQLIDGLARSEKLESNILAFFFYQILHFCFKLQENAKVNNMSPDRVGIAFSNTFMMLMGVDRQNPKEQLTLSSRFQNLISALLSDPDKKTEYQEPYYIRYPVEGRKVAAYLINEKKRTKRRVYATNSLRLEKKIENLELNPSGRSDPQRRTEIFSSMKQSLSDALAQILELNFLISSMVPVELNILLDDELRQKVSEIRVAGAEQHDGSPRGKEGGGRPVTGLFSFSPDDPEESNGGRVLTRSRSF